MKTPSTRISIGLLLFLLLFGAFAVSSIAVPKLEAAPITVKSSISSRVKFQEGACKYNGGTPSTSYGYEGGDLTSAQVTCKGGDLDGQVCANTATTQDCYQAGTKTIPTWTPVPPVGFPDTTAPHTAEQPRETPIVTDLADPGLPQEVNPGVPEPTPASAPTGPSLRPTIAPDADPRN